MFNIFSLFTKKKAVTKKRKVVNIKELERDIEETNKKIRTLYSESKIAIMNNDMNTVRIAAKVRNKLLNQIESLQGQRT